MARRRSFGGFRPYVPVAKRNLRAAREAKELRRGGRDVQPIQVEGRKITSTFWGGAWCDNLERYSDYESRLPRGRTYVRNGSVVDLQIDGGTITALVSGSDLYKVTLHITPLPAERWTALCHTCAGEIRSVLDLLQGKLSSGVMAVVTREAEGLFPTPQEITLSCSCPDWAVMCKHVAAVLYGVGARLDHAPEMLFQLRGVDPQDMVAAALERGTELKSGGRHKRLAARNLSALFGVDIETPKKKRR